MGEGGLSGFSVLGALNFFRSMSKSMSCSGFVQVDFILDSFLSMGIVFFTDDRTVKFPFPLFTSTGQYCILHLSNRIGQINKTLPLHFLLWVQNNSLLQELID